MKAKGNFFGFLGDMEGLAIITPIFTVLFFLELPFEFEVATR
jgi:hypothetical protein